MFFDVVAVFVSTPIRKMAESTHRVSEASFLLFNNVGSVFVHVKARDLRESGFLMAKSAPPEVQHASFTEKVEAPFMAAKYANHPSKNRPPKAVTRGKGSNEVVLPFDPTAYLAVHV
jgi:hypothetical protein